MRGADGDYSQIDQVRVQPRKEFGQIAIALMNGNLRLVAVEFGDHLADQRSMKNGTPPTRTRPLVPLICPATASVARREVLAGDGSISTFKTTTALWCARSAHGPNGVMAAGLYLPSLVRGEGACGGTGHNPPRRGTLF